VSCDPQVFSGITDARFQCLVAKAAENGIAISGNSGSASKDGITIAWNFDPESGSLTLQCTAAPAFVPCSIVNGRLQQLVASCP
jgi:hypothetical protein